MRLWDKEGCFEAYDDAMNAAGRTKAIFPVMGQTYHVEMNVELDCGTYDVYVTNADSERVRIADGYRFRGRAPEPEYIDSVVFVSVKRDDGFAENLRINGDAVSFGKLNTERLSGALDMISTRIMTMVLRYYISSSTTAQGLRSRLTVRKKGILLQGKESRRVAE